MSALKVAATPATTPLCNYAGGMDANELRKRENALESLLWDCVDQGDDPDGRGYESSGITKLAELLAGYEQRIAELEARLGERGAGV